MEIYNKDRIDQGKRCKGRTPYETFIEGVALYKEKVYDETLLKKDLAQDISWGECFDTRSDVVFWLNDLEKDSRYRQFPSSIYEVRIFLH